MSKQVATVQLSNIERIQIYINAGKKSLEQIKVETGADYMMNGGLFDMTKFVAYCHLKADDCIYAQDPYTYWGYGWDAGTDISMQVIPNVNCNNYICCVELIRDSSPKDNLIYTEEQGGRRGRTAIGLNDGKLCLYVTSDGSSDAKTPEELRDELASLGWDSAVMLDSGGSSQCDFMGEKITSSRVVHNLILVYLKKEDEKPETSKPYTVCLDPGHGPRTVNGSPDGTYKEAEFTWDMYERIRPLLEKQGITVIVTRDENEKPSLQERCRISNDADADFFISLHSNAAGGAGWSEARGLIIYTSMGPDTAPRNVAAKAILNRMQEAGVVICRSGLAYNSDLVVLKDTNAPANLIEYGFHTNKEDVALLKDPAYRDKLAMATAKGTCDFLGVPYSEETENEEVADWAAESWEKAVEKGILDGTRPTDPLTRQEFAVAIDRLNLI